MKFYEVLPSIVDKNAIAYREGVAPLQFISKALINVVHPDTTPALISQLKGSQNANVYTPGNEDLFAEDWKILEEK